MSDKLMTSAVTILERPQRLSDRVSSQMEAWIRERALAPGTQLPTEKSLCERFGVSRAVVREAISRLKAEGCVETRQGLGAFVAAVPGEGSFKLARTAVAGADDAAEIFELRCLVESGAAEFAAMHRSEAALARIEQVCEEMEQALLSGEGGAAADDAFHLAIAAASGNRHLERFLAYMGRQFSDSRMPTWNEDGRRTGLAAEAQAEHRRIVDAIRRSDPAAAGEAARDHLIAAARRLGVALRPLAMNKDAADQAGTHGEAA